MTSSTPRQTVHLADYRPSDYLIRNVDLTLRLDLEATEVEARLSLAANPAGATGAPLVLQRDQVLPERIVLDGRPLGSGEFLIEPDRLIIPRPPTRPFTLETSSLINPKANTTLNGLYVSNGVYCTQCEAEGFRRITPFIDRPDVLARYRTRIEAKASEARYLLANGNPLGAGVLPEGRHFAVWDDPWPKPSYLFAAVAGHLAKVSDHFVTRSGREVRLDIFVEEGQEKRAGFAMESLKRAMRWDEERFGREYDLDVFMLVAVSDFNMGAMENKGLNVFNDKYVLADAQSATDNDLINIEAIIGHEYFHNWTGNRITCRDWFQLCVKEGLTVFRDQEFTSDVRSRAVKRIADVVRLRAAQFLEDQGPLAHPVRPTSYQEINNFYTATVYEKGAEVIRMLQTLIGRQAFDSGMQLYFNRHDGAAVTVEDFIACFAEVSGHDLAAFSRWYHQAGTPEIVVETRHDPAAKTFTLVFHQSLPPAAGPDAKPQTVPIKLALLDENGGEIALCSTAGPLTDELVVLDAFRKEISFSGIAKPPVPSLLREFSAPVRLTIDLSDDDLLFLAAHDGDSFNRWQALQTVAMRLLIARMKAGDGLPNDRLGKLTGALEKALGEPALDPAYLAFMLNLPSESDMAREIGHDIDPDAIRAARRSLREALAKSLQARLVALYGATLTQGPFSLEAPATARRSLKNSILHFLCADGSGPGMRLAFDAFTSADNLTDSFGAITALCQQAGTERERALTAFYKLHEGNALVIDKWFSLQAAIGERGTLKRVEELLSHPAFRLTNPNRVRALIGAFAFSNPGEFNRPDGEGYRFVADQIIALDRLNPQVAARLMTAFGPWRRLEEGRRARARSELERIGASGPLSSDVDEIRRRSLEG